MASTSGEFVRTTTQFRERVSADGSSGFPAAAGRYHLYVSYACPWAHRAVIVRTLKGLEQAISMSPVDPIRDERGWAFNDAPGAQPDPINGFALLREAYEATVPGYDGYVSVPVLWDIETGRIVNNESAEVIVMLNEAFDAYAENPGLDLYPADLRDEIDECNERVYERVNNGVYRAGFATTQAAYEEAAAGVFEGLDALEERLSSRRYLVGDRITLADWRLFTTLLRFDPVYHGHFKCNVRRVVDYPALWGYLRDLISVDGVRETVRMDDIKRHYYGTHPNVNPSRIVPIGPALDYDEPHGREALSTGRVATAGATGAPPDQGERMTGNIDVMKDAYRAFAVGDVEGALAAFSDDAVWQGPNSTELPGGGEHRGREAIGELLRTVGSAWDEFTLTPDEFYENGDSVVVLLHADVRNGSEVGQLPTVHIARFEGDRILDFWVLTDTLHSAELLGLIVARPPA